MGYGDQFGIFTDRTRTLKIEKEASEKEEWVKALTKSKNYDKATKETIVQTENKSKKVIDNVLNDILNEIDSYKGNIEYFDYRTVLNRAVDNLVGETTEILNKSLPQLYSWGDEKGTDKLSTAKSFLTKFSFDKTLAKKAAKASAKYKLDMENRRSQMGGKIKTVSEEIKKQIIDGIKDKIDIKPLIRDVIKKKKKIYEKDLAKATDKEIRDKIKQEIKSLYTKQKSKIERIVRTEAINSTARATLLRYQDEGIDLVRLETSHDPKVCPKCRNLERSKKTWEINKLLLLGAYPLSTLTHPQCRCVFHPIIPELDYDNDIGVIKNVPRNETDSVKRLSKEIKMESPITFVEDVTDHPKFIESRKEYYKRRGHSDGKAKLLAENDRKKLKGKINHLVTGSGKKTEILLDSKADKSERFVYLIAKINAKRLWEKKSSKKDLRPEIKELFHDKSRERKITTGPKKLFFSHAAKMTAKGYFIEGYGHYIVHPEVLKEIDPELYEYLKVNVFNGRDFSNFSL